MGFNIVTENLPEKMYPGIIIACSVQPFPGIKMRWVTENTHVKEPDYFVDEQRVGPYRLWHHLHHLKSIEGGVLMSDIVNYQPTLGFIGKLVNSLIIKHQLEEIFNYRKKKIEEMFGKLSISD